MATLKERVPKPIRGPVGVLSYIVGLIGMTIGYILVMLGIILFFDLMLEDAISQTEAVTILVAGAVTAVIGYVGVKGFMYFSY